MGLKVLSQPFWDSGILKHLCWVFHGAKRGSPARKTPGNTILDQGKNRSGIWGLNLSIESLYLEGKVIRTTPGAGNPKSSTGLSETSWIISIPALLGLSVPSLIPKNHFWVCPAAFEASGRTRERETGAGRLSGVFPEVVWDQPALLDLSQLLSDG